MDPGLPDDPLAAMYAAQDRFLTASLLLVLALTGLALSFWR